MSAPASTHSHLASHPSSLVPVPWSLSGLGTRILATPNDVALTIARLTLGAVMFAHGAQKALGWFGGLGFSGTMQFMTGGMHIPAFLAVLAILAEFAGGIALVLGLFGRVAAAGIATNMIVAIATVHAANGFFMNWAGTQKGEGFEYHLLALALAAVVMVSGSGKWSVDRAVNAELAEARRIAQ